jgi:multidrug resistance efflux pump
MTLELVLDDDGNAVVKDGMPIYRHSDGKEEPFDVNHAMSKIASLNKESAERRHAIKDLDKQLKAFEGLDAAAAKQALETVKSLEDKELVDAGEMDKLKAQMTETIQAEKEELQKQAQLQIDELQSKIGTSENTIRHLLLRNAFSQDEHFAGKLPRRHCRRKSRRIPSGNISKSKGKATRCPLSDI